MEGSTTVQIWVAILGIAAFALSEILPFVKSTKANGILQGIASILGAIYKAVSGKKN